MSTYKMTPKELILTSGSSKGSQIKFYKDGYWYKIDEHGPTGVAEKTVSDLLRYSTLSDDEFVKYETCKIEYNDGTTIREYNGCRSKDFLNPGEMFFSYAKIYNLLTGNELSEDVIRFESPKDRIEFVASFMNDFTGLDVRDYIAKNLTCDMLFLNTDRHFNNLGVISSPDQTSFRNAPIFDNGAAFLSNYNEYPPNFDTMDLMNGNILVTGKPFAANLEYQAVEAGINVQFDFSKMKDTLKEIPNQRIREIMTYQIEKYESVLQIDHNQDVSMENTNNLDEDYEFDDIGIDITD